MLTVDAGEEGDQPSVPNCLLRRVALVVEGGESSLLTSLLVHFIIEMIRWAGLAPCEFEFPFPASLIPTFLWWGAILAGKASCKEDERAAGAGSPTLSGPLSEEKISYGGGECVGIASIARASDDRPCAEQGRM